SLSSRPFYEDELPIVNRSLAEVFAFADEVLAGLDEAAEDPADALQEVERALEEALGLADDELVFAWDDALEELTLRLDWSRGFSEYFGFSLDLHDFGFPESLSLSDVLQVAGGVELAADVDFRLDLALVLGENPEFEIRDTTNLTLSAFILADELDLLFDFRGLEIGVSDGYAVLNADGDPDTASPATLTMSLNGAVSLDQASVEFGVGLVGGFAVELPLLLGIDVGTISVRTKSGDEGLANLFAHGLSEIEADFSFLEGLDLDFSLLGLLNNPGYILDGVDTTLGGVQDVFGTAIASDIPLVGTELAKIATFIRDFRQGLLADLRDELSGTGNVIELVRDSLEDVFGNQLGILQGDVDVAWYDVDGNKIKDWASGDPIPKVGYVYDADGNFIASSGTAPTGGFVPTVDADAIQFDMTLGGTIVNEGVDIPVDFDLELLALEVNGGFGAALEWEFDFGFGLSEADGFYLSTQRDDPDTAGVDESLDPELSLSLDLFLDGRPLDEDLAEPLSATGKLLFFSADVMDNGIHEAGQDFQPSGVNGRLGLDLRGDADTGRLSFDHVVSSSLSSLFGVEFSVQADVNLHLALTLDGNEGLPHLDTDFVLSWGWDFHDGAGDLRIGLNDVTLDLGTFFSNMLEPIIDDVAEVLEPLRPYVELLVEERDWLETLTQGRFNNLRGLLSSFADANGSDWWKFVDVLIVILDQADQLTGPLSSVDSVGINLGSIG
ncbi:MAG: hypothetical protein ABEK36_05400, partial [Candidatus Aenigmatarchaeota archaeon]